MEVNLRTLGPNEAQVVHFFKATEPEHISGG